MPEFEEKHAGLREIMMPTSWIVEWIEAKNGDWGKHGRTYCCMCGGQGYSEFRYCPWCGRRAIGKKIREIIVEDQNDN